MLDGLHVIFVVKHPSTPACAAGRASVRGRPGSVITQVASITCTVDVDSRGHIRNLVQTTMFSWGSYTLDFTFSDFGSRSVSPPLASEVSHGVIAGIRF